jgi:indole-3-glycerol phosphate synthase
MSGVLAKILETKRAEISAMRGARDLPTARARAVIDAEKALRRASAPTREPLRLVCEIKLKSPSAGPLSRALGVAERAQAYAEGGARMVSVLVDAPHFDGSYTHLEEAARALPTTPVLAKEFVLDEVQIERAHAFGADAVLVIARIVEKAKLKALVAACDRTGLAALVEVFTEEELAAALAANARIIGVNARDLDALEMNAERASAILEKIPHELVALHLSGVKTPENVTAIAKGRADAVLVGEALMREDDPRGQLSRFVAACGV